MSTPYLRIRNLTKRFGNFTALDDVSLDIHKGELICFLGPSGCGKTTLLRAISGLDIQTHGTVEQDGQGLALSRQEFRLLHLFMRRAGQVLSQAEIMDDLYELDRERELNRHVVESWVKLDRAKWRKQKKDDYSE